MYKPVWSVVFALLLQLLWVGVAQAVIKPAEEPKPPSEASQIEDLNKELEEMRQEHERLVASKNEFSSLLQQAPDLVDQMRREIVLLEKQSTEPRVPTTLEALERAIALLDAQAKALQFSLNDVMDRIGEQQALPSQARDQVASAQRRINELQDLLRQAGDTTSSNPIVNLKNQLRRQELANATQRRDNAQNRLEGYQKLLEMYTVNRDLLLLRLNVIKTTLELLRAQRDNLRQQTAEQQQEETEQLHSELGAQHELVLNELEKNQELSKTLYALTDDLTRANDALAAAKQDLQDLRYRFELAQQQLELTQVHQQVDDYLVRQRQTLLSQIREQESEDDFSQPISQSRLDQFNFDDQLRQVRSQNSRDKLIDQLLKKSSDKFDPSQEPEVRLSLQDVLTARSDLLNRLVEANANYVVALTNLELTREEQLSERQRFFEMLNEKLMWRRSSAPLDLKWLQDLPGSVLSFASHPGWIELAKAWMNNFVRPVFPVVGFLLAAGALFWPRRKLLKRLEVLREHIGNVMKDKFRYTGEALAITMVLALPFPLLTFILSFPLLTHSNGSIFVNSVGQALAGVSFSLFVLEFVRHICLRNGLAAAHFSWRTSATLTVRRWLPLMYWQIPLVVTYMVVWTEGNEKQVAIVGRAAYLIMATLFLLFTWRALSPSTGLLQKEEGQPLHWYQRFNRVVFWLAVLVPAGLLGLAVKGFNFSAMTLHGLLYQTVVLAFAVFVLDQVCMRWFAVQERKIALERALAKREAMKKVKENLEAAKTAGEGIPEVELPSIDVATISEQNRGLLKVISYGAFFAGMWWLWQDTLQAANIAGEFVLWHYSLDGGENAQQIPVTLGTVVLTLIAILLTYAGVKNLPGLIETVVLQRFSIDSGIRFAITTTARYIAIVAGIMIISGMMGVDWSKLGWLVAALGVGLGFGLQEIFANFISGLIILYERPIRIGDTVTINDLTGTVSRIRMRATTITDWDQKEIIIPNKTFVTSQFINWTLSDDVTRLVVKVGVLFGSNTELVTRTLLDIAEANDKVLPDPAPTALLLGFGDSDYQFELRVFIDQFSQRMILLHELNTEINRRLAELGVRLAFPQLDLHIKDMPAALSPKTVEPLPSVPKGNTSA